MTFTSLNNLLEHIKEVEQDTINLSKEAQMKISSFIERNKIELDDEAVEALQYPDIISQQLSATIESLSSIQKAFDTIADEIKDNKVTEKSSLELNEKLDEALDKAKIKRDAFSGHTKTQEDEHEIEFF